MKFNTPAMRLSIALVLLMINLLFLINLIGLVPDESESESESESFENIQRLTTN
jgi:hypothetical protein